MIVAHPMLDPRDNTHAPHLTDESPVEPARRWFGLTGTPGIRLRAQVVREAHRETWFVENQGDSATDVLAIDRADGRSIRRVQVNGEGATFEETETSVLVRPAQPLASGAGTTVIVQFR